MSDETKMAKISINDLYPGSTAISHEGTIYTADADGMIEAPAEAVEHAKEQAALSRAAYDRRNRGPDAENAPDTGAIAPEPSEAEKAAMPTDPANPPPPKASGKK